MPYVEVSCKRVTASGQLEVELELESMRLRSLGHDDAAGGIDQAEHAPSCPFGVVGNVLPSSPRWLYRFCGIHASSILLPMVMFQSLRTIVCRLYPTLLLLWWKVSSSLAWPSPYIVKAERKLLDVGSVSVISPHLDPGSHGVNLNCATPNIP